MKYKIITIFSLISLFVCFSFSCFANGYAIGTTAQSLFVDPWVTGFTSDYTSPRLVSEWGLSSHIDYEESLFIGNGELKNSSVVEVLNIRLLDVGDLETRYVTLYPGDVVVFKSTIAIAAHDTNQIIARLDANDLSFLLDGSFNPDQGSCPLITPEVKFSKNRSFYFSFDGYGGDWEGFKNAKGYACVYDVSFTFTVPSYLQSVYRPYLNMQFSFNSPMNEPFWLFFKNTDWYFGPRENAPLYSEFENSQSMDDYYSGEAEIMGDVGENVDSNLTDIFDSTQDIFSASGDIYVGAHFLSAVTNFMFDNSFVSGLISISLTLGIIALTLNLGSAILGRVRGYKEPKSNTTKYITYNKFYGRKGDNFSKGKK